MKKKNVLIFGANFANKGAQSMLFVTMDEVLKRYPTAELYFVGAEKIDLSNYNFKYVFANDLTKNVAKGKKVIQSACKSFIRDIAKIITNRNYNVWMLNDLKNQLQFADIIIDISGFNLGKKWDSYTQEYYLDNIRLAKKYNIPIVLMPQSFGPFDYPPEKHYLINEMAELLPYAFKIFAREKEGYNALIETFHLSNVELSSDLVLQNNGIDLNHIFSAKYNIKVPRIECGAVGIVPNKQCFNHGDKKLILSIYSSVIEKLILEGKKVYVFRHSSEDLEVCKELDKMFSGKIILLQNDFSCLEYDQLVRSFEFIICSRYHGIVHAYKNHVPCVLLGWAVKYKELSELLEQSQYSFDITDASLTTDMVIDAVGRLCINYREEADLIGKKLIQIQKDNCFDKVFDWLDKK